MNGSLIQKTVDQDVAQNLQPTSQILLKYLRIVYGLLPEAKEISRGVT